MENTELKAFYKPDNKQYASKSFWGWNGRLEEEELREQIRCFEKMGMQGFYMHPRVGLDVEYLSDEFMDMVAASIDEAGKLGMKAEMYDEDGYPSGSAGGRSTNEVWARARYILFTPDKQENFAVFEENCEKMPCYLASYDVKTDQNGNVESYVRLAEGETAKYQLWYAYLASSGESGWHNRQASLDILNPRATERFLQVTHEEYRKRFRKDFGGTMTSCFTDEPGYPRVKLCDAPFEKREVKLPWTAEFTDSFLAKYGFDILDSLPELVWETNDGSHMRVRYCYYNHLAELFERGFFAPYAKWCSENGLTFTGHLPEEQFLQSQAGMAGDCMRYYPYFDVPGIDLIRNQLEYPTAKQAQSVMHQQGKKRMMSEMYGVTNWHFDFRSQKYGGDWQAAMGVTDRVIHLSWYTMKGKAKRDCPPPFGYQQPWCEEYHLLEDHYARLNSILIQGEPIVKIGMIHPLESFWMYMGSNLTTGEFRRQLEEEYNHAVEWLMEGTLDFDYISEALLPKQYQKSSDACLHVGVMQYDAIVVPSLRTVRQSTLEILEDFCNKGGKLIVMGKAPSLVDGQKSVRAAEVYGKALKIEFDRVELLQALEEQRLISIYTNNWNRTDNLIYTFRKVKEDRWLFIAHSKEAAGYDALPVQNIKIVVKGVYNSVLFDTVTGSTKELDVLWENDQTIISYKLYAHDSLLIRLQKCENEVTDKEAKLCSEEARLEQRLNAPMISVLQIPPIVEYSLSEENACLLDCAEYSMDGIHYCREEDIYKISKICGQELGILTPEYYKKEEQYTDPWLVRRDGGAEYPVYLRFLVKADVDIQRVYFACEEISELKVNELRMELDDCGYYADKSIRKYRIPVLRQGDNVIDITVPYSAVNGLEYCYLTGDFGVEIRGREKRLTALPGKIGFSSFHTQGLPFYGGCVTYHVAIKLTERGNLSVKVPSFRCVGVKVLVDGKECGIVAFAPYELKIKEIDAGEHVVEFVVLGNRFNIFGGVHNYSNSTYYEGNYFMSGGDAWGYEYRFREMGLLASPVIRVEVL